jgi:DNA invertase Pin-like site-specific DNA recombinase
MADDLKTLIKGCFFTATTIATTLGVSRATIYRVLSGDVT